MSAEDIILEKLRYRCCRQKVRLLPKIQSIVDECRENLNMLPLHLICCESLTRTFSAFFLRAEPYLIYDSCLLETLYLYDCILYSGAKKNDMDKLFYKMYGEELLLCGDLDYSSYLAEMYISLRFSFENEIDAIEIEKQLSRQNYFLIAHEIAHLSLRENTATKIPEKYRELVRAAVIVLTKRIVKQGQPLKEVLAERTRYFLDTIPKTIEEYFEILMESGRFIHFVEECYCDFIGLKMLLEHYDETALSIKAVSSALNYLIMQESIRCDLEDGIAHLKDVGRTPRAAMYFSVLRTQLLLITLEMNESDSIAAAFAEIYDRSSLTERLVEFVKVLPDREKIKYLVKNEFLEMDRATLADTLLRQFYYAHIGE